MTSTAFTCFAPPNLSTGSWRLNSFERETQLNWHICIAPVLLSSHNQNDGEPRSGHWSFCTCRILTIPTVKEIPGIIHLLTQSPPSIQEEAIETYFTPNASFTHPFCRTGSWNNSRWLVGKIYRWYKIMSPRIDMSVQSVGKTYPYPIQ